MATAFHLPAQSDGMEIMDTNGANDRDVLIQSALQDILNSKHFLNAPTVRAFLSFVVEESIAGRGDRIKAYTIALEVFGRDAEFDPSNDTIVRTTAGRVRKALQAYYLECENDSRVVISLPNRGYAPAFDFPEAAPPPCPDLPATPALPDSPQPVRKSLPRAGIAVAACLFVAIAVGAAAILWLRETERKPLHSNVVIDVPAVEYDGQGVQPLARAIDIRLAPALSRIGLAQISPSFSLPDMTKGSRTADSNGVKNVSFILKSHIINDPAPELRWQLIDVESGYLLWSSKAQIPDANSTSMDGMIDRIAFEVLGEGGAVPLLLIRYQSPIFSGQACLSRAQLLLAIENATMYPEMRECLERTVSQFPNDASAWAILSSFYIVRTHYYLAESPEGMAKLLALGAHAAAKAEELAPDAYLTKVAQMHLAVRQGRTADFDALQKQLRTDYPGDMYLKLRLASRITRLGRGREALGIYDEARNAGISLKSNAADIALAYFVEGDYEQAYREIASMTSTQPYALLIKAAIFGKLGMVKDAKPVVDTLAASTPGLQEAYLPWLAQLSWTHSLLVEIADGLAKAGIAVSITPRESSASEAPAKTGDSPGNPQGILPPPKSGTL